MVLSKRRECIETHVFAKNTGGRGCGRGKESGRRLSVKKAKAEKPHWDWGCWWCPGVTWW